MNIKVIINNDAFGAELLETEPKSLYAFYLCKDNAAIIKLPYAQSNKASFNLRETGNGIYYISGFCKKENGEREVINSAQFRYISGRKPSIVPFVRIEEMEMTNHCNLSCPNCCTPTTSYPKGFIDDRTVLCALAWTQRGQTLNYHRQGEPLLHRELEKYIRWGGRRVSSQL